MIRGVATDIGPIHFVGIGGIGMSGIAEVMKNLGYTVQGSDVAEGYVVQGLRDKGIAVTIGHAAENVADAAVVVTSTAITRTNPEVEAALRTAHPRRPPRGNARRTDAPEVDRRGRGHAWQDDDDLAWSRRCSMRAASTPPSSTAASSTATARNARLGASDWMVVEADESDGSFLRLDGTIAVVTNIDPEHLDHYGTSMA